MMKKMQILEDVKSHDEGINQSLEEVKNLRIDLFEAEKKLKEKWKSRSIERQRLEEFSPFQIGDKVTVANAVNYGNTIRPNFGDGTGIVSKVVVKVDRKDRIEYEYKVNKIKKNGKMSMKALRYNTDTYAINQLKSFKA